MIRTKTESAAARKRRKTRRRIAIRRRRETARRPRRRKRRRRTRRPASKRSRPSRSPRRRTRRTRAARARRGRRPPSRSASGRCSARSPTVCATATRSASTTRGTRRCSFYLYRFQHFNALLADLVRNPDLPWREAKKQLKKDHRYALAEKLTKDDKERLFTQHIAAVAGKRRSKLRAVLDELKVAATAPWRDVRAALRTHAPAPVYASAQQMEREFRDYQRDKQSAAKTALRQLLLETRSVTHKTLAQVRQSQAHLATVHDALKHDARYTALDHIAEEREQIITGYLEELEKKGPPPPPTATEPARRAKQPA